MRITPLDIKQQPFKRVRSRYDAGEVDSFLNMVALEMEGLLRNHETLKDELRRTKARLDELTENEKILKDAIISTQKSAETILENARQKREIIIAEAKLDAETLVRNAHEQVKKLTEDVTELRRQRARVEAELSAILHAHIKMLEATCEEADRHDEEADKVAILSKK
ncbi:MAG: DivIVA domain-containing protein [Candidatus Lernaella stagnicola]|nr:DivIVA domain-containing protein [Candidatus Lernaella stagnicola]